MIKKLKRIYEESHKSDGFRVLVDRLWPRGVSKEKVHLDLWLKEIAPTTELRKWFAHDTKKWDSFVEKYRAELSENHYAVKQLKDILHAPCSCNTSFARVMKNITKQLLLSIILLISREIKKGIRE